MMTTYLLWDLKVTSVYMLTGAVLQNDRVTLSVTTHMSCKWRDTEFISAKYFDRDFSITYCQNIVILVTSITGYWDDITLSYHTSLSDVYITAKRRGVTIGRLLKFGVIKKTRRSYARKVKRQPKQSRDVRKDPYVATVDDLEVFQITLCE